MSAPARRADATPLTPGGVLGRARLRPRLLAFATHLGISATIALVLGHLILYRWYPGPFFFSDGGWRGMLIVLGVDVVIGPTLTLVAFDVAKPRSKIELDLSIIAFLQAAALAWGVYVIHDQRPVAVVFAEDGFLPVTARPLREQGVDPEAVQALGPSRPPLVYSLPPRDRDDLARMFLHVLNEGWQPFEQFDRMRPLREHLDELSRHQVDLDRLLAARPAVREELRRLLAGRGARREDFLYLRFTGRYRTLVLVLTRDGRLAGALERAYED